MRAAILNGGLSGDGLVDTTGRGIQDDLRKQGWQTQLLTLREIRIAYCLGCFECWTKTPGVCRIDDGGRHIADQVIRSDLVIYLTPITFGGYSSELKKAVDRIICLISPLFTRINGEVHHRARYARYPALAGIGVLARPNAAQEQIFDTLVERNALNMHAPGHASGVVYRDRTAEEAIRVALAVFQAAMPQAWNTATRALGMPTLVQSVKGRNA